MNNQNYYNKTIIGISSVIGKGAIGIVRLSGDEAISIVNKVFKGKDLSKVASHTISYGHIIDKENKEILDEVLVSVFKKPKTYTKEDVVEINCHGGRYVTERIYNLLVLKGATPAASGEFTKRAFLNGRIDLTKAEAVMDIIEADNKAALKLANKGLSGYITQVINDLRNSLLDIIAKIAVNIDYPEYDDVEIVTNQIILPQLLDINSQIETIIEKSHDAQKMKDGINVAIVGRPNVGKSTLLNALISEEKAIVTDIPGTTRDIIEGKIRLGSTIINFIDTAGIRNATDKIEKIGISKTFQQVENADVILYVVDENQVLIDEDIELMKKIKNKNCLIILNKSDLYNIEKKSSYENNINIFKKFNFPVFEMSALRNVDVERLKETLLLYTQKKDIDVDSFVYITNARQLAKIGIAKEEILAAIKLINNNAFIEFVETPIRQAWYALGEVIGEVKSEDLMDEIFSKFCLGK